MTLKDRKTSGANAAPLKMTHGSVEMYACVCVCPVIRGLLALRDPVREAVFGLYVAIHFLGGQVTNCYKFRTAQEVMSLRGPSGSPFRTGHQYTPA